MYSFQTGSSKRKSQKTIRILSIVIFVLAVALIGLTVSYLRASSASRTTSDALMARATNEANEAQTAVYRLTQSSGTNTMTLLSNVRAHIYAMQCLNTLASNIYGAGTVIVDGSMLSDCITTLDAAEQRLQAGSVLTGSMTELRDEVDAIVALFNAAENAENEFLCPPVSSGRAAFLYPFAIRHTAVNQLFRFRRRVHQPRADAHRADIQRSQKAMHARRANAARRAPRYSVRPAPPPQPVKPSLPR